MTLSNDITNGIICPLESYIKGSNRFYGTQHSMISQSIHRFGSGTMHWSSGNYLSLLVLVSEFTRFDQFILECIEYDGIIKYFVLIMQGRNHIGMTQSGYKMCGKLLDHLLEIKVGDLLNKSLETWVDSWLSHWRTSCPEHEQKTLFSWKHPCVTIGAQCGAPSFFYIFVQRFFKECLIYSTQWILLFGDFHEKLPDEYSPQVTSWVHVCLGSFCHSFSSRLLMYAVNSGLSSGICGGALAVSWGVNDVWCWIVDSSGTLLLVAHTEAFCTSRVGVGRRISSLVPWGLERSMKIHTQKIHFTIPWPAGSELIGNADLLLYCLKEGVHHLTPWVQIASRLMRQGTDHSLDHHRQVSSQQMFEWTNKLMVCRMNNWNWTLW